MIHIYKNGTNENTLLLLHGTGGDENDLLDIANIIDNKANVLSVRGNVKENNYNRFFKRLGDGVFDIDDLVLRTMELNDFISKASIEYGFSRDKVIALGFSNGANIAGSLLFHQKDSLNGAILLRPMVPRRNIEFVDLKNKYVYISAGLNDEIVPRSEVLELDDILKNANAITYLKWVDSNHSLTYDEFTLIKKWYNLHFIK